MIVAFLIVLIIVIGAIFGLAVIAPIVSSEVRSERVKCAEIAEDEVRRRYNAGDEPGRIAAANIALAIRGRTTKTGSYV